MLSLYFIILLIWLCGGFVLVGQNFGCFCRRAGMLQNTYQPIPSSRSRQWFWWITSSEIPRQPVRFVAKMAELCGRVVFPRCTFLSCIHSAATSKFAFISQEPQRWKQTNPTAQTPPQNPQKPNRHKISLWGQRPRDL